MKRYARMIVNLTAFLFGALLLHACASAAVDPTPAVIRDAGRCLQTGPCTVLQVDNTNSYDAIVYVNGTRHGQITGNHAEPIFLSDSELRGGRCITVVVRLSQQARTASAESQCTRLGGRFSLQIMPSGQGMPFRIVVTPWDR